MIDVRPYEPDDLPALWALAHLPDAGVTEDPTVPVPLRERRVPPTGPADLVDPAATVLGAGGDLFVAVQDGHVVGVGGLRPVRGRPRLGRLVRIRVHPAVRRRGVGRSLMVALEGAARHHGFTDLLLDVGDHQPEALGFYRALEWSETWREDSPEWHWQTVWFHRSLERDHLPVEVRPCSGEAEVAAAEHALPTGGRTDHLARWQRQQAGEATYLLAWDRDQVVGHILLESASVFPDVRASVGAHPEVHLLNVADRVRRRGVGTALVGAAAGVAQEKGAALVGLALLADDDAALTIVQRLGWAFRPGLTPVDEVRRRDHRGAEHVAQEKCTYWTLDLAGRRRS